MKNCIICLENIFRVPENSYFSSNIPKVSQIICTVLHPPIFWKNDFRLVLSLPGISVSIFLSIKNTWKSKFVWIFWCKKQKFFYKTGIFNIEFFFGPLDGLKTWKLALIPVFIIRLAFFRDRLFIFVVIDDDVSEFILDASKNWFEKRLLFNWIWLQTTVLFHRFLCFE